MGDGKTAAYDFVCFGMYSVKLPVIGNLRTAAYNDGREYVEVTVDLGSVA